MTCVTENECRKVPPPWSTVQGAATQGPLELPQQERHVRIYLLMNGAVRGAVQYPA
jgi:hypothetical protein